MMLLFDREESLVALDAVFDREESLVALAAVDAVEWKRTRDGFVKLFVVAEGVDEVGKVSGMGDELSLLFWGRV